MCYALICILTFTTNVVDATMASSPDRVPQGCYKHPKLCWNIGATRPAETVLTNTLDSRMPIIGLASCCVVHKAGHSPQIQGACLQVHGYSPQGHHELEQCCRTLENPQVAAHRRSR